ncbi:MAG: hypothetical protein HYY85_14325, partial [Deltaproteobacteria bacterium]|nr:hypothetical protein [Deltaproteobacteria bacterium]
FPEREKPRVIPYSLKKVYTGLYGDLKAAFHPVEPLLKLAIYNPEVFRKGEPKPLATGRIVTVCLDLDSQQPRARKIPEEIVRLLRGDVRGH